MDGHQRAVPLQVCVSVYVTVYMHVCVYVYVSAWKTCWWTDKLTRTVMSGGRTTKRVERTAWEGYDRAKPRADEVKVTKEGQLRAHTHTCTHS